MLAVNVGIDYLNVGTVNRVAIRALVLGFSVGLMSTAMVLRWLALRDEAREAREKSEKILKDLQNSVDNPGSGLSTNKP